MKRKTNQLPAPPLAKLMAGATALAAVALGLGWLAQERAEESGTQAAATSGRVTVTADDCCDERKKLIELSLPGASRLKGGKGVPSDELDFTGDPEVDALSAAFAAARDRQEKLKAADALAAHGSPAAVERLLTHALEEPDRGLRRDIARALDRLSDRDGFAAAVSAFGVTDDRAVVGAVNRAVTRMADGSTVEQLVDLYRSPLQVRTQRGAITRAIASVRNPEAARALSAIANTAPEPGLVEAAARGLSKIGGATAAQGIADAMEKASATDLQLHASLLDLVQRIEDPAGLRVLQNLELMNP